MTARYLDGKALSLSIQKKLQQDISDRLQKNQPAPRLDVILVGDNPASVSYIGHKQRACNAVGINSTCHQLPALSSVDEITACITTANLDPNVNGILLQLPIPNLSATNALLELIDPLKDVDGFHPYNMGRLVLQQPTLRPCTPYGIITLLQHNNIPLTGKHAVIVGASNIVGRPMALELLLQGCTITLCHKQTADLQSHIESADILISATGKSGIINSKWIKPQSIVIDVGFSKTEDGKIIGDIDFETAVQRAAWITPVPGGVGPMTVATLLQNTLQATKLQEAQSH